MYITYIHHQDRTSEVHFSDFQSLETSTCLSVHFYKSWKRRNRIICITNKNAYNLYTSSRSNF